MALVNVCPKNEFDVIQASKRLGCGNDIYGNNRYLCIPNENKTSLVEFCFQGIMGIVDKGNCLELSEGKVKRHSCNQFSHGCPETHFYDYDIYKHPACQNINTELQCYNLDRNCTAYSNTAESEESSGQNNVLYYISILGSVFVFIVCLIVIMLCYKRRNRRKKRNEDGKTVTTEEETPLSGAENLKGKSIELILLDKTGSTRNAILGNETFKTFPPGSSSSCSVTFTERFEYKIYIFDAFCIFDTTKTDEKIQREISICIRNTSAGPHAIILVLNIAKCTEEERKSVEYFEAFFEEENIFEQFIVLFIKEDGLDEEGIDFDLSNYITNAHPTLQKLLKKCQSRYMKFNTKLEGNMGDKQVQKLLSMVFDIEKKDSGWNGNQIYLEAMELLRKKKTEETNMLFGGKEQNYNENGKITNYKPKRQICFLGGKEHNLQRKWKEHNLQRKWKDQNVGRLRQLQD